MCTLWSHICDYYWCLSCACLKDLPKCHILWRTQTLSCSGDLCICFVSAAVIVHVSTADVSWCLWSISGLCRAAFWLHFTVSWSRCGMNFLFVLTECCPCSLCYLQYVRFVRSHQLTVIWMLQMLSLLFLWTSQEDRKRMCLCWSLFNL